MVSILILTKNEEVNIEACIASVRWSDDIVVLDSQSDDKTTTLAQNAGVRIVERAFTNWSDHQNWAVRKIEFLHPWVFYMDADERCDDLLRQELTGPDLEQSEFAAFRVRRKDFFQGCWLRRAQLYPTWITRVFRPGRIRWERRVNPVAVVDGPVGDFQGHLLHHPFSHGVAHWLERHNGYSSLEAAQLVEETAVPLDFAGVLSADPTRQRRACKRLLYGLPLRPWIVWAYLVFLRRGILDGKAGLTYATLRAFYEFMIDVKVVERRRNERGLEI